MSLAASVLNNNYDRVFPVTGPQATLEQLVDTIGEALGDPEIDELDLLWHGHGVENEGADGAMTYWYSMAPRNAEHNGLYEVGEIVGALEDLHEEDRLRMFYTTACWGAELADRMVDDAGFACGSGARAVNTNATLEYPLFLKFWEAGRPFGTSVSSAMRRSLYQKTDREVSARDSSGRFSDTDSRKVIFGDAHLNIWTNAQHGD